MAAVAGDPDVSHAAPAPSRFPGRRADARGPAHLRPARPQLVTERAVFRLVIEQRNGHLNDHARARSCRIGWTRMTLPSRDSGTDPATIDTSPDYGRSEELTGTCIGHRRDEFFLASKCGCPLVVPAEFAPARRHGPPGPPAPGPAAAPQTLRSRRKHSGHPRTPENNPPATPVCATQAHPSDLRKHSPFDLAATLSDLWVRR